MLTGLLRNTLKEDVLYELNSERWIRFEYSKYTIGVKFKAYKQMEMGIYTERELRKPFQ